MDKIKIIENSLGEVFVVIDRGNDEYTSMLKSIYDEEQSQNGKLV
jgi:hypothetical protein